MKATTIYKSNDVSWIMFGRDPDKPGGIIDTNQYMVMHKEEAILLDPGGIEIFSQMLTSVLRYTSLDKIRSLFASHQDPDIISSLGLWDQCLKDANLYAPWLWEGFIRHFGMTSIKYESVPDEGYDITIGDHSLTLVPAHYLHSSGNFNVYDPEAKILMSGDIGAALDKDDAPIFVEDFESHVEKMKYFHQRWMPSNRAKQDWVNRVRQLDIEILAPQHGGLFRGEMVTKFIDWFEQLEVGVAVPNEPPVYEAEHAEAS